MFFNTLLVCFQTHFIYHNIHEQIVVKIFENYKLRLLQLRDHLHSLFCYIVNSEKYKNYTQLFN